MSPGLALRAVGFGLGVTVLGAAACLDHRGAYLATFDDVPPSVVSTNPGSSCDGGLCMLIPGAAIEITFSELMDPRSLRPGIAVQPVQPHIVDGGRVLLPTGELPVTVTIPPPAPEPLSGADEPYPVRALPVQRDGGPLEGGRYQLTLRTLLIDTQGNPLADQVEVPFVAP